MDDQRTERLDRRQAAVHALRVGGSELEKAIESGRVGGGDVEGLGAGGGAGDERDRAAGDGEGFGDGGEGGLGRAAVDGAFADADDQGAVVVAADAWVPRARVDADGHAHGWRVIMPGGA